MKRQHHLEVQSQVSTPDGTGLFVRVIQQPSALGKMPIILNDGLGCNGFIWKHFIDYFQHQHPIIHWHYRGHGHSDIPSELDSINIPQIASDMTFVLDHLRIKKALLAGHSMGVQVALEAYHQFPEKFTGLALLNGSYEYPLKTWQASQKRNAKPTLLNQLMNTFFEPFYELGSDYFHHIEPVWSKFLRTDIPYQFATLFEVNRALINKPDFKPYFDHLADIKPHVFFKTMKNYSEHSAKAVLSKIQVPTLIISGGQDTFSPRWVALDMHHAVENSEMLFIPSGTHCTLIEHPELIQLRIEKFLWSLQIQQSKNSCRSTTGTSTPKAASKRQRATANS
ncbi:MAG: alpha/beta hydrolase [Deltaproteobacteria bacterium]|nr:alpha/beta hydrolase [Deltaproteobacteria bacterium]